MQALLLTAIANDARGDVGAASRALEHALDLGEHNGFLLPFLLIPAPGLLMRHARARTAHAALVADITGRVAKVRASETEVDEARFAIHFESLKATARELVVTRGTNQFTGKASALPCASWPSGIFHTKFLSA